jgi:hypothetical protein
LEALDFGSNSGSKLGDDNIGVIGLEEVRFGLVSQGSLVGELEWFGWWEDSSVIVDGKIVGVLILWNKSASDGMACSSKRSRGPTPWWVFSSNACLTCISGSWPTTARINI